MVERELEIEVAGGRLSGTLCAPDGSRAYPLVVMLHGTGPVDRDENMPGQRVDIFNAIAHQLAKHGIGSLRYDKRGCAKSTGHYLSAGQSDFVADASAWVEHLITHEQCEGRVFLLGHSEGCLIAPRVALQRKDVAGIVLLCPLTRSFEAVLMQQATQIERELSGARGVRGWFYRLLLLSGSVVERQQRLIARIKSSASPTLRVGLQKDARTLAT